MSLITQKELRATAAEIYRGAPIFARTLQSLRPAICPFGPLMQAVPPNSSILDIGCGHGLFLMLLDRFGQLGSGLGIDTNHDAIEIAQSVLQSSGRRTTTLRFETFDASKPLSQGQFDVVSMIDVLHHIPPPLQRTVILSALSHVRPGGLFVYKDMVSRPLWRALANRLHDLVMARQIIHYCSIAEVSAWVRSASFELAQVGSCNMLWYGHEWIVARRRDGR
jgi:2-polyprenyl-3-methyl-5-hydroxy-6-metoxy-1,4-benzoquinol methylase